ncbi:MAG: hypothetical protein BWZ10_03202 [candidate division BRC1 bacterium ADurb.BinA364]|nr:MAG: hypothetical protein BWZ10_03202 [candidate division BRC1 bacterium ADurb.BinA364]
MFAKARPDLVTLEMLGWMDFEDLDSMNPSETLDPAAWNAAREAAAELRGEHRGPFPEALHQEVYRFCIDAVKEISPGTPVAVCHGTAPTWNALGSLMGMTPGQYICNCGFASTPGQELYDRLATR